MAASYPHITQAEFDKACEMFANRSRQLPPPNPLCPSYKDGVLYIWQIRKLSTHRFSLVDVREHRYEDIEDDVDDVDRVGVSTDATG